ncbi:hypothetical protein LEP1GSC188_2084 [Leptospira weilii serovar Topaz str. LT2116]|uniref:Transcriptional coactivator p15 (PC4) C-terminal domain-containing protein n=1 Tax=Leptospira weilii serovar Topaz str. LT2116 TaxID=1088540 RepID=M3H1X3_9LEPT|nr:hypothetical protein LEP1GSC188_2084 [Leptospira weilii serovar Topaz str. LT2116]
MGVIRDIDKGKGEVIRVEVSEYKGTKYLNLRVWYTDKDGEKNRLRKESQFLRNSTTKSEKRSSKPKAK